jgi:hypothetical protein
VSRDRRDRLQLLQHDVLPLLHELAEGAADPLDAAVRTRCGIQAAALRRALVNSRTARDPMLSEIRALLDEAGRTGVAVDLQLLGSTGDTSPEVRAATRRILDAVLAQLPPQRARLTMLAGPSQTELFLTFRIAPAHREAVLAAAAAHGGPDGWRAAVSLADDDDPTTDGYLEIRWSRHET